MRLERGARVWGFDPQVRLSFMSSPSTDPALLGSIITSIIAVLIALFSAGRDNRLRRQDWAERQRATETDREREDLTKVALLNLIFMQTEESLIIAIYNAGSEPVLSLELEADSGQATFKFIRKAKPSETAIQIEELSHEEWASLEFILDNGVGIVPPGTTYPFECQSPNKSLTKEDVIVTFILPSGYAYGKRVDQVFRCPERDIEVVGQRHRSSSFRGLFT